MCVPALCTVLYLVYGWNGDIIGPYLPVSLHLVEPIESGPEGGPSGAPPSEGRGDVTPWTQCSPGVLLRQKKEGESVELLLKRCTVFLGSYVSIQMSSQYFS